MRENCQIRIVESRKGMECQVRDAWCENFWLMSHDMETIRIMMNESVKDTQRFVVAPKPGSLW